MNCEGTQNLEKLRSGSEKATGKQRPVKASAIQPTAEPTKKTSFESANEIEAPSQQVCSVLIVDDHVLVAEMIAHVLPKEASFAVDVEKDLQGGLERINENGGYDIVLLDDSLPQRLSISEVERVVEANSKGYTILFSGSVSGEFVNKTLAVGAVGLIPKTLPLRSMLSAIQLVLSGEPFVPAGYISNGYNQSSSFASSLNDAEIEILKMLGEGLRNKEIMKKLQLSESTVKMRVRSLCRKVGARNRTHAVILGRELGILL